MQVTLSIASATYDEGFIQKVTRDLSKTLNQEFDVEAKVASGPTKVGDKGDAITTGAILISILGGGGLVSLINVIKSFFDRSKAIEIDLERPDGKKLKLKADDLNSDQSKRTMKDRP